MNISAWAIRNPVPVILLFLVLTVLGLASYFTLPITYFPTIDVPKVEVTVTQPAASPEQLEIQTTKAIEDALVAIPGIEDIESTLSEGRSVTTAEFEIGVPTDRAISDVRDAVARVRDKLPALVDEPTVERLETENQPVVIYSVGDGSRTQQQLSLFVEDVIVRKLQGLPGVGRVELVGNVEREIQVRLDADRLDSLGLTANQVSDQIGASQFDLPSGRGTVDAQDKTLATKSAVRSLQELGAIRLALSDGNTVAVSDVAKVQDTIRERETFARLNGAPVVGFTVYKAFGASDVDVAENVAGALTDLQMSYPATAFEIVDDSVTRTLGNHQSAQNTLIEGAVLAIAVVFIFLRDWRATVIAAISLPLSAIPTFWVMEMAGFSLNMLSLLAITLVTGILVDDSIVEIENIVRHRNKGKTAFAAAMDASGEIGLAVMAISAAIIAVFAPVGLMGGEVGQYFRQFGLTVAVAVFFSLLVARLVTPLLAAFFMGQGHKVEHEDVMARLYRRGLAVALRWRWSTLAMSLAFFAGSIYVATLLPAEFLPAEDTGRITVSIELPPGSTLLESEKTADIIAGRLRAIPAVRSVFVRGGAGADGTPELRRSVAVISLLPKSQRSMSTADVEKDVSTELFRVPDIRFEVINDRGGRLVSFAILSPDGIAASKAASDIVAEMRADARFKNPTSSEAARNPTVELEISPDRVADMGVTATQVAQAVRVATIGDADTQLANFSEAGRNIPIRAQLDAAGMGRMEKLRQIRVKSKTGDMIPLEAVADFTNGISVSTIQRMERERRIEIGTDLASGLSQGQGIEALMELPAVKALPPAVRLQATGDSDTMDSVFTGFAFAMGAGMSLVLIVLILLFASPLTPLTILTPLPLAIGGVVGTLWITGYPMSLPVVIGVLMLMGIVVKNSIMLVDFAVELERSGLSRQAATIEACAERVRPIVMTTLAMIAGMMPAAFGHADGGEFRAPMAMAVIGGLAVSTLLSLFVVPAAHIVIANFGDVLGRAAFRLRSRESADQLRAVEPLQQSLSNTPALGCPPRLSEIRQKHSW